jgi:hypothetical protein
VADRIAFYMDEHVPRAVTEGLRRRGVDVLTAQEARRLEDDDQDQLAFATAEGRVLFSQDADFLRLHAEGRSHCGIAYAPQQTAIGVMVRGLMLIYDLLTPDEMRNQVEFL